MCCKFYFCQVDDGAVMESPMEGPSRRSMRQRSVSNNAERSPVPESRSKREKVVSASPERPPSTGFVRRSTRVHKPVQPFQAHPNTRYVVTASAKLNFASIFYQCYTFDVPAYGLFLENNLKERKHLFSIMYLQQMLYLISTNEVLFGRLQCVEEAISQGYY